MKRSAASSFRTPHNTLLTTESKFEQSNLGRNFELHLDIQFDERRTFLTEYTNGEQYHENNIDEQNPVPLVSTQQTNSFNDYMKNHYVVKVLEIKTVTTTSGKQDRTKSASDKGSYYSHKGNATVKSTQYCEYSFDRNFIYLMMNFMN